MSTIYVFHTECPAHSGAPLAADRVLMYNSSSGRTEYVTAALLAESGRTVTAGTTSGAFAASGITRSSTLLTVATLTDPTQAGQETTIVFPSSTAISTVAPVAATILGSTVTPTGATKITNTPTSDAVAGSITLVAISTAQWVIKGGTMAKTTLGAPLYITTT
jgi:hypothetical protein